MQVAKGSNGNGVVGSLIKQSSSIIMAVEKPIVHLASLMKIVSKVSKKGLKYQAIYICHLGISESSFRSVFPMAIENIQN